MSILYTKNLTKKFGGLTAVDGVNFQVEQGELRALIGPNGAGKSTFLAMLSGRLKPTDGEIFFMGENITTLPSHAISRKGIATTFQITSIFPGMTVYENIWVSANSKRGSLNPLVHHSNLRDVEEKTEEILKLIDLKDKSDVLASNLSYGDQRLLEIGIALATDPELLLLDEPVAGLSPKETREMSGVIESLAGERTIILVEHDMDVVMNLAEKVTVFDSGKVIAEGTPEEISHDKEVIKAYLGEE